MAAHDARKELFPGRCPLQLLPEGAAQRLDGEAKLQALGTVPLTLEMQLSETFAELCRVRQLVNHLLKVGEVVVGIGIRGILSPGNRMGCKARRKLLDGLDALVLPAQHDLPAPNGRFEEEGDILIIDIEQIDAVRLCPLAAAVVDDFDERRIGGEVCGS